MNQLDQHDQRYNNLCKMKQKHNYGISNFHPTVHYEEKGSWIGIRHNYNLTITMKILMSFKLVNKYIMCNSIAKHQNKGKDPQ